MATLKGKALIAYLVVCVFWGSTYLAIKVGVTDVLRDLRGPNSQMNTRTTIVLSTLFEKPGLIPTEPD